jgi:hypothetical protein
MSLSDIIKRIDPDQDAAALERVAHEVGGILTANEEILYIALQNKTALSLSKDCAAATSNRLIVYRPQIFGRVQFDDFLWEDIADVRLAEGMLASTVTIDVGEDGDDVAVRIGNLDKSQARALYAICQQKEQEWREKRRVRQMEEDRARAGGVYVQPQTPTGATGTEDPVERLAKAKRMLDQQLISEAEYETLKAKILADM